MRLIDRKMTKTSKNSRASVKIKGGAVGRDFDICCSVFLDQYHKWKHRGDTRVLIKKPGR